MKKKQNENKEELTKKKMKKRTRVRKNEKEEEKEKEEKTKKNLATSNPRQELDRVSDEEKLMTWCFLISCVLTIP